jgi:hypothetical protein
MSAREVAEHNLWVNQLNLQHWVRVGDEAQIKLTRKSIRALRAKLKQYQSKKGWIDSYPNT